MMLIRVPEFLMQPLLWRVVGFASSVVGLLCYALSFSFTLLFGDWNFLKIMIYSVVSLMICSIMLFAKKWKLSRSLLLKSQLGFSVLMLTSFYSFFYDKAVNGSKPHVLSLISCASFALMLFSLSRQTELRFEVDLPNFFFGCLTLQLMKINLMLALVGAAFSYTLIFLRSSLDSQMEIGNVSMTDHLALDINDSGNGDDYRSHRQELQSLRKRSDDGYEWIQYGQKQLQGSENSRSYFKCAYPHCSAKKKIERSLEGKMVEIVHKGSHDHPKPQSNSVALLKNLSTSEGYDDSEQSKSGDDESDEDEPDATRWDMEDGVAGMVVREPRVVINTRREVHLLDDGYRCRKYGQRIVKGNPNPRSYYKCRHMGCPVRKQIQRGLSDPTVVISTYEGKHSHAASFHLSR